MTAKLSALKFCLRISDVDDHNSYNISFKDNEPQLKRAPVPDADCALVIDVPSRILRCSMKYEWGGDAISIGYGADFNLRDRRVAAANLDQICFRLLTRHPTRKGYIKQNPRRVFSYLIRQPPVRTWKSWKKSSSRVGNVNYERSVWLLRDAAELRQIFGLPALDETARARSV